MECEILKKMQGFAINIKDIMAISMRPVGECPLKEEYLKNGLFCYYWQEYRELDDEWKKRPEGVEKYRCKFDPGWWRCSIRLPEDREC